jgi:hypothetical protein
MAAVSHGSGAVTPAGISLSDVRAAAQGPDGHVVESVDGAGRRRFPAAAGNRRTELAPAACGGRGTAPGSRRSGPTRSAVSGSSAA